MAKFGTRILHRWNFRNFQRWFPKSAGLLTVHTKISRQLAEMVGQKARSSIKQRESTQKISTRWAPWPYKQVIGFSCFFFSPLDFWHLERFLGPLRSSIVPASWCEKMEKDRFLRPSVWRIIPISKWLS